MNSSSTSMKIQRQLAILAKSKKSSILSVYSGPQARELKLHVVDTRPNIVLHYIRLYYNIAGVALLFSPTTSLFLFNKAEINTVLHQQCYTVCLLKF